MSSELSPSIAFKPRQTTTLAGTAKFPFDIHVTTVGMARNDAYALRFKAYDAAGYAPDGEVASFADRADELPTTAVIIAYDKGRCVGTLRVCFSHPWQSLASLPCAPYYPELRSIKRDASGGVVEVGRMAIDPAITNTSYRTTLYASMVRAAFIAAQAGNASHILVSAKASGIAFYKAMLGFKAVGAPALYPPGDIPITLLAGTIGDAEKKQRAQNAFFRITLDEIASMKAALAPALAKPTAPAHLSASL